MFDNAQPYRQRHGSSKKNIRVLAADDCPVALAAICSFLETLDPVTVVGTALSGYELLEKAEKFKPELVITDLRMPRMSGLECTLHLRVLLPAARVIVLTEMEGPFASNACLEAGADVCIHKTDVAAELIPAIRRLFPKHFRRAH